MTDGSVHQERSVTSDGEHQSGVAVTSQTTTDPVSGGQVTNSVTQVWSGRSTDGQLTWLIAGVVIALLAFDFVFHAAGANSVGFAAFVFAVGSFFAAPFAGIFKTSYASPGNLVVWADLLAMVMYACLAAAVVKVLALMSTQRQQRPSV